MSDVWYFADRNGRVGPLTLQALKEALSTFPNTNDVLVWRVGFQDWKPARDVVELSGESPLSPPLPSETVQSELPEPVAGARQQSFVPDAWYYAGKRIRQRTVGFTLAAIVIVIVGAPIGYAITEVASEYARHKEERELAEKNATNLQALRSSDPKAYLDELKARGDSRWEEEFQTLDRKGYELFLIEVLRTIPASDLEGMLVLYVRLNKLEPTNADYEKNRASLARRIAEDKQRKQQEADQLAQRKQQEADRLAHPERFVTIERFSWSTGGFGSVMEANFTIQNALPWAVKDIEIRCEHTAPSGTTIDSNTRTIYERIGAREFRTITKFNMGFIHSQATRSGCRVVRVVSLR